MKKLAAGRVAGRHVCQVAAEDAVLTLAVDSIKALLHQTG